MIAYNFSWYKNLHLVKEVKQWSKQGFISKDQYNTIHEAYASSFYHPNLIIRILLFIATVIALAGITGMLGLMTGAFLEDGFGTLAILYGVASLFVLEKVFIQKNHHYKSGVNEALLYHSLGWIIGGVGFFIDFESTLLLPFCLILCVFAAIRYADIVSTIASLFLFSYILFTELYDAGPVAQQIIPILFIVAFTPLYFVARRIRKKRESEAWTDGLIVAEAFSLIVIYAAGNYFVVRELSIELMGLALEDGEDIPFALLFYFLTAAVPIVYLYLGIKRRDVVLLRVSLVVIAFSAFTFKYYFSLGHPEITLTVSGAVLLIISMLLFRYLRTPRNGFTRENLLKEKWAAANPEAFIISQTMGGNTVTAEAPVEGGGGGITGGGGSSDGW